MLRYKYPGVYIEEVSLFQTPIQPVATAIPAFIGYTQKGGGTPTRITSIQEFEQNFGGPFHNLPAFIVDERTGTVAPESPIPSTPAYYLYYQLQMYFANGGDACYIVSAGSFLKSNQAALSDHLHALDRLKEADEPELVVFTDARAISDSGAYHRLMNRAFDHCAEHGGRFTICDVRPPVQPAPNPVLDAATHFRSNIESPNTSYGAAYFPDIETTLTHHFKEQEVSVKHLQNHRISVLRYPVEILERTPSLKQESLYDASGGRYRDAYHKIVKRIRSVKLELPPSAAVAGIYRRSDRERGVWKSPANIALQKASRPIVPITNSEQRKLNTDLSGISINAIRHFPSKGTVVWGARTLDGSSNEWKYIAVRRCCNMVQASVEKGMQAFVFEPNNVAIWQKVRSTIENFLNTLWRQGAFAGNRQAEAYYVKAGLGQTMTQDDIKEGRMSVELGMALIRPAEFIILRFSQKMRVT